MTKKLKVLYVSPEVAPFAKTGGLADVAGSLPVAIKKLDHDIRIITPLYQCTMEKKHSLAPLKKKIFVPVGSKVIDGTIYQGQLNDVPIYFIRRDSYFDRKYLYGNLRGDYSDNAARFVFFSRAVLETLRAIDFFPDIIHCNDWHTGLLPVYLKTIYKSAPSYFKIASLYSVHNVAYHGAFPESEFPLTCLPKNLFNPWGVEFWGKMNFLKGGILFSDLINTVSEQYSKEIQTEEYGFGLDGVFRDRKRDLFGILNGVDYDEWNPATDKLIVSNYCEKALPGKRACKKNLLKEFGLKMSLDQPVIGIISRLTDQKGFDIIEKSMAKLMAMPIGIVILGTGDSLHQKLIKGLAKKYPERLSAKISFDNVMAHKIQAGSDLLLMPSRYEPCGLTQIYSLRYGTIPIVRATGGLDDTIINYDPVTEKGNGFKFSDHSAKALIEAVDRSLQVFKDTKKWNALMRSAMTEDFSWRVSAKKYEELYSKAIAKKNTPLKMSKVLVIQHSACEDLGTFALPLKERGFTPSLIAPYKGDSLPDNPEKFKAIIILGGPIGVDEQDKYPYLKDEISLIRKAVERKIPTLGICLGAQLLAAATGAAVYKGTAKEIGWFKIILTKEGLNDQALCSLGKELDVFQWHGDTFELPEGSIRLAGSELFKNQAFRIGDNAYGLQFHLEVTEEMIKDWLSEYNQEVSSLKDMINPKKIIMESPKKAAHLSIVSKKFLFNFLNDIS